MQKFQLEVPLINVKNIKYIIKPIDLKLESIFYKPCQLWNFENKSFQKSLFPVVQIVVHF